MLIMKTKIHSKLFVGLYEPILFDSELFYVNLHDRK